MKISAVCDSYEDFSVTTEESLPVNFFNKSDLLSVSPRFNIAYTLVERTEGDGYMIHFDSIGYGIYCHVSSYHFLNDRVIRKNDRSVVRFVKFFQIPKNKQELETFINNNPRVEDVVTGFFAMFSTFGNLMSNDKRFILNDKFNNNDKLIFDFANKKFSF